MAVLVDTDQLIEVGRRSARGVALDELIGSEERAISAITVSELLRGVLRAGIEHRGRRIGFIERFLAGVECIPIDETVARIHAAIGAGMAASGVTVETHDLWIGATALANDMGVATHNARDFTRIPGLRVLSPPSPGR